MISYVCMIFEIGCTSYVRYRIESIVMFQHLCIKSQQQHAQENDHRLRRTRDKLGPETDLGILQGGWIMMDLVAWENILTAIVFFVF